MLRNALLALSLASVLGASVCHVAAAVSVSQPGDELAMTRTSGIEGSWSIVANGFPGKMELQRSGSGWSGRVNIDGHWETLQKIAFNQSSGRVSFLRLARGSIQQHYTGTVTGNQMSGKFDGTYNWTARRTAAPPPPTATDIAGHWSMNANGYPGPLEFTRAGSGWTGRLNLDGSWEPLRNIVFNQQTGRITFLRLARGSIQQHYTGTVSGSQIKGTFDGSYAWSARR